ncbi:MAG: hypothetical protein AB1441_01095 [Bacillota bacterium]
MSAAARFGQPASGLARRGRPMRVAVPGAMTVHLPSLIANTLYRFDVNIRMSIFLGVVGAGGIGFNLVMSMRLLRYQEAMAARDSTKRWRRTADTSEKPTI